MSDPARWREVDDPNHTDVRLRVFTDTNGGKVYFTPDDSLRQIADAWKTHSKAMGEGQFLETQLALFALLDALVEGNEDE